MKSILINFFKCFIIAIVLFFASQVPSLFILSLNESLAQTKEVNFLFLFFWAVSTLLTLFLALYLYKKVVKLGFGYLNKANFKLIIKGNLLIFFLNFIFMTLLNLFYGADSTANNDLILNNLFAKDFPFMHLATFVNIVILAPVLEEIIFRGFILKMFDFLNPYVGIFISSTLFSVAHVLGDVNIISFLIYFSMGFIIAYIYHKTGKLSAAIAVHSINNLVAFFALLATIYYG